MQKRGEKVRRPAPSSIRAGRADSTLTGVAGLVPFGAFLRQLGLDAALHDAFGELKQGSSVVYPMACQMRLLIDANAVGEQRVFGVESLAADPLFEKLAGGTISSIDTIYRDLTRMDEEHNSELERLTAQQGLDVVSKTQCERVHCDIDTTVETVFGNQEGAELGYNPRYRGRPSYHPLLSVVAETGTCVGAKLRPGNTGLGEDEASLIEKHVRRVRASVPKKTGVVARIDSGADCTSILAALDDIVGTVFVVKAQLTHDLALAAMSVEDWTTVEEDADGSALVQFAELPFQRAEWTKAGRKFRVVAIRRRDRDTTNQNQLWLHLDYTAQVYITNDETADAIDIATEYDGRAEIEPLIADLKNCIGIGKVPSLDFDANQAMFLLKLLTRNLVLRYAAEYAPDLPWRGPWLMRALFRVPGRLTRSGRCTRLHTHPASRVHKLLTQLC
jgi:hypothetical protein